MCDHQDSDTELNDFSDPLSAPDWEESEDFEMDAYEGMNFDETLYLDEADRGSAAKRRYTTARARQRRDTPKVRRSAARSRQRSRKSVVRQAVRRQMRRFARPIGRHGDRALASVIPDRGQRVAALRDILRSIGHRAVEMGLKKAPNVITPRQIIRLPFQLLLTSAAVEWARRTGRISESEARDWSEAVFHAIGVVDMALILASQVVSEDDDFEDDGYDAPDFEEGAWDNQDDDGYAVFEDEDGSAPDEDALFYDDEAPAVKRAGCNCGPKGDRIAVSRALRNAARQLLRAERRLARQG